MRIDNGAKDAVIRVDVDYADSIRRSRTNRPRLGCRTGRCGDFDGDGRRGGREINVVGRPLDGGPELGALQGVRKLDRTDGYAVRLERRGNEIRALEEPARNRSRIAAALVYRRIQDCPVREFDVKNDRHVFNGRRDLACMRIRADNSVSVRLAV